MKTLKRNVKYAEKPFKEKAKATKKKNTKVSTTDPESGFMTRDNKPQGFFYLDHRTVDGKHNIILDTLATPANINDSQPYIKRLDYLIAKFCFKPQAVGLDAGYFTAPAAECLKRRDIKGVFGYRRPVRTHNDFKKRHFIYDKATDTYRCPQDEILTYRTTSRESYRSYATKKAICRDCPKRSQCTLSQDTPKTVTRHIYGNSMDEANQVRLSAEGKRIYRRRSETVERSFTDVKQHHGHRYARFRGLTKVQIQCFLAATAQNIKEIALWVWKLCLLVYFVLKWREY